MSKTKKRKPNESQSIDELQRRYDDLSHERTRVEERRATAQSQLEELRQQAVDQFGTDDVKKLEKQLSDLRAENERKRHEYQESLEQIEQKLADIDENFSESNQPEDDN